MKMNPRVGIRVYASNDIDELYRVIQASADHLKTYMLWYHDNYSIDDTRSWVDLCIADTEANIAFRYLIYDKQNGEIIGATGIEKIDAEQKLAELGYWVSSSHINQGIVSTASVLTVNKAFTLQGLHRVEIIVHPDNLPSNRVAQKLGATYEGKLRNRLMYRGRSIDANCYSLIPSDLAGLSLDLLGS